MQKDANLVELEKCCQTHILNYYLLATFRFDTAENEPAKNLQNFANFCKFKSTIPQITYGASYAPTTTYAAPATYAAAPEEPPAA